MTRKRIGLSKFSLFKSPAVAIVRTAREHVATYNDWLSRDKIFQKQNYFYRPDSVMKNQKKKKSCRVDVRRIEVLGLTAVDR